ncbi:tRNA (mnm(5)s(2)U34)-methyltransferase [Clostridium algidicarnis]|uniref:Putative rRNA methylase n=1 Tax=Clostridium algidicarnis DSM 15099 TaxID=1121295 RepID=A0A2S6FXW8_9CLOT|nr:class I SAM-dependent methyltransferase [Clostridium algidicarnis]MBB6630153.1 class I SAM-dependent methyltransferase [Clostridium algidicarnis]MBU3194970.1 class I SAM-dependent methyltransferase [Clostridium algidicarnis]MBU3206305.1 class I SAM-dependent methyltransferase [Clostridium algidicarnis]MCB2285758.1 class I SAM-dependent methyltransferase [Clostridium algidicarnis]PPK48407.1 putative rRNA methylase [Clostridium algidicarnis DSM 15099]
MFNYTADISVLSHNIIRDNIKNFDIAIDATLGNGKDTDFLSKYFKKVYSFEIQHIAIENYKNKEMQNVNLIEESHEFIDNTIKSSVDCIIYNLGYLPGGDKNITTNCKSTLISIKKGLELLKSQGIMAISMYSGHEEGKKEKEEILKYASSLDKLIYGSMLHETLNRNNAPSLLIIEKR